MVDTKKSKFLSHIKKWRKTINSLDKKWTVDKANLDKLIRTMVHISGRVFGEYAKWILEEFEKNINFPDYVNIRDLETLEDKQLIYFKMCNYIRDTLEVWESSIKSFGTPSDKTAKDWGVHIKLPGGFEVGVGSKPAD